VLALIHEVEREIVPGRERLEAILEAINDPAGCSEEIEILEREIGLLACCSAASNQHGGFESAHCPSLVYFPTSGATPPPLCIARSWRPAGTPLNPASRLTGPDRRITAQIDGTCGWRRRRSGDDCRLNLAALDLLVSTDAILCFGVYFSSFLQYF
jgi:hypothetical protein